MSWVQGVEEWLKGIGDGDPWVMYVILFLVALAEAVPVLGYLAPGPSMLLFGGILAAQGKISFAGAILAGAIGGTVGDYAAYVMGHRWFRKLIVKFRSTQMGHALTEEAQAKMEGWVRRWGGWAVFFARFQQIPRNFVPFLAGTARMPAVPFAIANFSSSVVLSAFWVGVGFYAVTLLPQIENVLFYGTIGFAALSVVLALVFYLVCVRWKLLEAATLSKGLVVVASIAIAALYLRALRLGLLDAERDLAPAGGVGSWLLGAILGAIALGMIGSWIKAREVGALHVARAMLITVGSVFAVFLVQGLVARVAPGEVDVPALSSGPASVALALAVVIAWWPHMPPWARYLGLGFTAGAGVVAWVTRAAWPTDIAVGWLVVGGWAAAVGLAFRLHDWRVQQRAQRAGPTAKRKRSDESKRPRPARKAQKGKSRKGET